MQEKIKVPSVYHDSPPFVFSLHLLYASICGILFVNRGYRDNRKVTDSDLYRMGACILIYYDKQGKIIVLNKLKAMKVG